MSALSVQPLPATQDKPARRRERSQAPSRRAQSDRPDTSTGERPESELVRLLYQSVATLDRAAVATLLHKPDVLGSALAAAAQAIEAVQGPQAVEAQSSLEEVMTIAGPSPRLLDHTEATERLSQRTHIAEDDGDELLTSDEFARRAGARSRQTVHNWLNRGRIVGWEGAKRGLVFPAEQLDASGRPIHHLGPVLSHFQGHYAAWRWLTDSHDALDGARPIDLLREGEDAQVEAAAKGYAQGDFG